MSEVQIPEFITPRTIEDMTDEEYEAILGGIRERRMVTIALHTQARAIKAQVKGIKLQAKIDRYVGYIEKTMAKVEKLDEELRLRISQLRAVRLEAIELEDIGE